MGTLDRMSRDDLAAEKKAAQARLKEIEKAESEYQGRRMKELRGEIDTMLEREGFSLEDIYGGRSAKRNVAGRSKGPAKYRHPENHEKTWSGRGRQPAWYKEALESGKSKSDLEI